MRLVKPKYVIPIDDWFLSPGVRTFFYRLARMALANEGIEIVAIDDFDSITLGV